MLNILTEDSVLIFNSDLPNTKSLLENKLNSKSGRDVEIKSTSHVMPNRPNLSIDADQANKEDEEKTAREAED